MKKGEKKRDFDFYSNNEKKADLIKEMKSNSKVYLKLISALQILGCFEGKTKVDLYDSIDDENGRKTRLWCSDINDNLFIFYANSSEKKDMLKIIKETNESIKEYDLSLAKKFNITLDNIELTRSGKIFNFKYGRLITDNQSFYSLFMGGDVVYQVSGNFDQKLSNSILKKLNETSSIPTLFEFIKCFEMVLVENCCAFSKIGILAFKDGISIGNIVLEDKEKNKTNFLKRKKEFN